jgi:hypothetical protein
MHNMTAFAIQEHYPTYAVSGKLSLSLPDGVEYICTVGKLCRQMIAANSFLLFERTSLYDRDSSWRLQKAIGVHPKIKPM